jgi:D-alanyl-D-alanine carboxypeptidase
MEYKINNNFCRQMSLAILLLAVSALSTLTLQAESVISFSRDRASSVAVVIRNLSTGEDIVSQNPYKAMIPASTMKCFTTAAALVAGLDTSCFETSVSLVGEIEDGVLHGDLVVEGSGDPTINSAQFPSTPNFVSEIAKAVKQAGVKEIEGVIRIDSSRFPDDGPCDRWEISDTKYEYGAGLYSLNYRDNRVGDKAMDPQPSEVFGEALENSLLAEGVNVDWDEVDLSGATTTEIVRHKSPQCSEIMTNLMKRSDNLFAEGMLRKLAPHQSRSTALAREKSLLANLGLNFDITDIYDGSGLSRNNRVTAKCMADLLALMANRKGKNVSYVSLFPVVGKEGTVKQLLTGSSLTGQLVLKSGSMNGVHCYAGYKIDSEGAPTHAVVILINDFFCSRNEVRSAIASFLKRQFKNSASEGSEDSEELEDAEQKEDTEL